MANSEERDAARKILADVKPEQCFWLNNGPTIRNMEGLALALATMDDAKFAYHSNKSKNDFARWVGEVIGDKKLAKALQKSGSRKGALRSVKARANELKKLAGQ